MIPRLIHNVWFGGPLSHEAIRCRRTILHHNPDFTHILWREDECVRELGLNILELKDRLQSWASVSNLVRLLILEKHGGLYLDSDIEALKPLDPLLSHSAVAATQDDLPPNGRVCNAFLGAEKWHPWIRWQVEHAERLNADAATGVYLASEAPRDGLTLVPRHLAYPWPCDAQPEAKIPHPDSILLHHWQGSWTK